MLESRNLVSTIMDVNTALEKILQQYLLDLDIDIRFDIPDKDNKPDVPTISLFLYDVHEDLQLRQSESGQRINSNNRQSGRWINLNCNYLITYWDTYSDGKSPDQVSRSSGNSVAVAMSIVLQALLNNRQLDGIKGAYSRIIPPQENLNSLGNFWQSIGNRPHLALMYSVTVPMLLDDGASLPRVKTLDIRLSAEPITPEQLNADIFDMLFAELKKEEKRHIKVDSEPEFFSDGEKTKIMAKVFISGFVDKNVGKKIDDAIKKYDKPNEVVQKIKSTLIYIQSINKDNLLFVD